MGRHVKYRELDGAANSILLPKGTTAQQPGSPQAGQLRYNETLNALEFYNGTAFVQVAGGVGAKVTITVDKIPLDGSTLIFTDALAFEVTAESQVLVFIEGVFQKDDTYSISGRTITLTSTLASDAGKTLTVIHGIDNV